MTSASSPIEGKSAKSKTLERGLDILETVMANPNSTISDVSRKQNLSYSTVHRIVSVLIARGYLRLIEGNSLALGPRLIEAGFTAHRALDIVQIARPQLEDLSRVTGDTVHLARLEGNNVVYLDKLSGSRMMEIRTSVGSVRPAISTAVGKALFLDWSEKDLLTLFQSEKDKIARQIGAPEWLEEMRNFAANGLTLDLGDSEPEIRCIAAPIRDSWNVIVASISLSSIETYLPPHRVEDLKPMVKIAAKKISQALGHKIIT